MRILILGAMGMLGHRLWKSLGKTHDVWGTMRSRLSDISHPAWKDFFGITNIIDGIDVSDKERVRHLLEDLKPDVVINAVGIIKQLKESHNHLLSIEINALLPHQLSYLCQEYGIRFIHFSTDCVFKGNARKPYTEEEVTDALDLYGRTKALGEVGYSPHALTIRTSIIGREIRPKGSLVDWFLGQKGKTIQGYQEAVFSGLPTQSVASILEEHILPHRHLNGVLHLAADPISKFDLLKFIRDLYDFPVEIIPNDQFKIYRALDDAKFRSLTTYVHRPWKSLIQDLKIDHEFYNEMQN